MFIFFSFPSTVQFRVDHFRNGILLEKMIDEKSFDFNFQHLYPQSTTFTYGLNFEKKKKIFLRSADSVTTHCVYETSGISTVTKKNIISKNIYFFSLQAVNGGESTTEEMCLFATWYYPAIKSTSCFGPASQGCDFPGPGCGV